MSVVVSVRIPRRLKEELDRLGVNVSEVVRKALEEEVERRRLREAMEAARELRSVFSDLGLEQVVRMIREDRESR